MLLSACIVLSTGHVGATQKASVPAPTGIVGVNHGPGGMGFPVGKFCAMTNCRHAHKDQWYLHASEENGPDKDMSSHNVVVKTRYEIAEGWDVRTATAFLINTVETDGLNDAWSGGFGGKTVIIRNQFAS